MIAERKSIEDRMVKADDNSLLHNKLEELEAQSVENGTFLRDGNILYSLMHHGWIKGKEQFRNRIDIKFGFDRSVDKAEREKVIDAVEKAVAALKARPEE